MLRILVLVLIIGAAMAYKWSSNTKRELAAAAAAAEQQQPAHNPATDLVDQINRQLPRTVIPRVMEMRSVELEENVARFHLHALGRTEIREQRFFDESRGQLREFYCTRLRQFVNAGISVEFIAHSAPTFEDIRTRTVQIRTNPSDCALVPAGRS